MAKTPPESKLSPKQAKVLDFIQAEIGRFGRPPTYRDIAKHCGYDAVGTVQDHVTALIKKGFLEKLPGVARGIQLAFRTQSFEVPILGTVPAGHPAEAIGDTAGSLSVSGKIRGEVYALRVVGESMIDAGILDGDYVIVKKQTQANPGDIIVAMIDGEATVKYLERKNGHTRLMPANPRFSPIELNENAENVIHGKVISLQRYYEE